MKTLFITTLSMVMVTAALNSAQAGWLSDFGAAYPQIQQMELDQARIDAIRQQTELERAKTDAIRQQQIIEFVRKYIEVIEELGKRESDPALVFEIKKLTTGPGQLFNKRYSNDAAADAKINFFQAKAYILEQRMMNRPAGFDPQARSLPSSNKFKPTAWKEEGCRNECEHMLKDGELKKGVTLKQCIKTLCY